MIFNLARRIVLDPQGSPPKSAGKKIFVVSSQKDIMDAMNLPLPALCVCGRHVSFLNEAAQSCSSNNFSDDKAILQLSTLVSKKK